MPEDLCFAPAAELAARIRRRDLSPVELVDAFLERIEARNGRIGAYVTVLGEEACEGRRRPSAPWGPAAPWGRCTACRSR